MKADIRFASEGFNHIVFKSSRTERERSSQLLRFNLLPKAVKLLQISTTYQEFEERYQEIEVMSYKNKIMKTKIVHYWGIIGIIDNRKIKVIIRRIGENGALYFWSIIPDFRTSPRRDKKLFTLKLKPKN